MKTSTIKTLFNKALEIYSQQELALLLNVPERSIYNYMQGNTPGKERLRRLNDLLDQVTSLIEKERTRQTLDASSFKKKSPTRFVRKDYNNKMRLYRAKENISQDQMASIMGTSQQHYTNIEQGITRMTIKFAESFRDKTGVDLLKSPTAPSSMSHGKEPLPRIKDMLDQNTTTPANTSFKEMARATTGTHLNNTGDNMAKKPRRVAAVTAQELREKFPQVADAFELLMKRERKVYDKFRANYIGKYHTASTGALRRVTLGSILECLEDYGYEVRIRVIEPDSPPEYSPIPEPVSCRMQEWDSPEDE